MSDTGVCGLCGSSGMRIESGALVSDFNKALGASTFRK